MKGSTKDSATNSSTVSRSGCFPRGRFQGMMVPASAKEKTGMVKNLWGKEKLARAEAKNGYRGAVCFVMLPFFTGVHMEKNNG